MNETPKISIVMCTYNGAQYLDQQLDSLLAQSLPPYEIIIQDDGSTDATEAVANTYAMRFPIIHFYHHEGKPGINRNFFSAMRRATGDLIAICDQDDIWETDKLAWQVAALGDNWLVGGISQPFSTDGSEISSDVRVPNIDLLRMMYVGMMPGHTQLFRRDLLDQLPSDDFFMYDLQTQAFAAATERIAYVPRVVVHQRRHQKAATYSPPVNHNHSLSNIYHSAMESLRIYRTLRPAIRNRFSHWLDFLHQLPFSNATTQRAIKMAELQTSTRLWDRLRLVAFCIRHRHRLFHSREKNPVLAILRGAFFPISCATYYRYLLADAKYKGTPPS